MADALRMIAPRELALSFVLVIVAFCCRVDNAFMMMLDLHGAMPVFLAALCAGVLAGCVGAACRPAGSRRAQMAWIIAGTASSVAGLTVAGFVQALPLLACALPAGALLGFGLACALCQWWVLYASLSPAKLLFTTAVSVFLASVLWYVLKQVGTFPVTCFCLVVCALCGGLLCLLMLISTEKAGEGEVPEQPVPSLSDGSRAAFRRPAAAAVAGLLFNFFTLGLTFWPAAAGLSTSSASCKPLSYALVLVALIVVVRRSSSQRRAAVTFAHVALPIAAAIVLASPFVDLVVDLEAVPFSSALTYLGIALFNVLGLALPLCALRRGRRSACRAAAVYLAGCVLALATGMAVFQLLGHDAQVVSLCIMAAYLAALVIVSVRAAGERSLEGEASPALREGDAPESSDKRLAACGRVAEQYALSPREAEILRFLSRGHGAKYIAERLCISADTVRTHCKRIYEKTGVHAKDELLELVEHAE